MDDTVLHILRYAKEGTHCRPNNFYVDRSDNFVTENGYVTAQESLMDKNICVVCALRTEEARPNG